MKGQSFCAEADKTFVLTKRDEKWNLLCIKGNSYVRSFASRQIKCMFMFKSF